jgi:pimeloyl-ACP methyl ester carboxylesterase
MQARARNKTALPGVHLDEITHVDRICLSDCLRNFQSVEPSAPCGDESASDSRSAARLLLILTAVALASAIVIGSAQAEAQLSPASQPAGSLIELPDGHHMFLECSGDQDAVPTVILANGRGLGTADSWALVQQKVPASIRTCSYDAMGAGHSDKTQGAGSIDRVASEMDALFKAARLRKPYVLVGASAGGVLIRRYQQQHTNQVAGLVFVDSSHEEMQWRDAAIAPQMDPDWNNAASLRDNGFLYDHQKLTWHADIPLVVLERSERVPQAAFPNLTPQQIDGINAAWHDFQVDLASRSKYGQLRVVPNSGHRMHQERPDAIAQAIQDVVHEIQANVH